jgi:polyisoprenoid-binding protein YceI
MRSVWRAFCVFVAAAGIAAAQEGPRAPLHYKVTQQGSVLRWDLPATMHTVHGSVGSFQGTIDAEPSGNGAWSIRGRFVAAADSMTTGNARRDRKMKEKTLETSKFPEIVFETSEVTADLSKFRRGEQFAANVSGNLTVHGVSVPVQLPVDVYVFPDHAILAGSFPVHWKKFDLKDPSPGLIRVKEPMMVSFRLKAVPAS